MGFFRRATKILDELTEQLQNQPESVILLRSFNSLGNLYCQQGNLARSEEILKKNLALARKLDLDSETSQALLNLGNTRVALANQAQDLNEGEETKTYRQQALGHYKEASAIATFPLHIVQAQLNQFNLSD